jgi:hypothetical protein
MIPFKNLGVNKMRSRCNRYGGTNWAAVIGVGALALVGVGGPCTCKVAEHSNRDTHQVQIIGTERLDGDSDKYVVFTRDLTTGEKESFENSDSWFECFYDGCKWDSSTLQAKIKDCELKKTPVEITTYGWRVPFMSWYENIVNVRPLEAEVEDNSQ